MKKIFERVASLCAVLSVASMTLAGCGKLVHTPESVALCRNVDAAQWEAESSLYWNRVQGDSRYYLQVRDMQHGEVPDPTEAAFWGKIVGGTFGKMVGERQPAMLYDSRDATVEIRGEQVHALPGIWRQDWSNDRWEQSLHEISGPVNLNTPFVAGKADEPNFYIAFPIRHPAPSET